MDILQNPLSTLKTDSVVKNGTTYRLRWLQGESYQTFMKEIIPILHKTFENIERQRALSNSPNEVGVIMITKNR